MKAIAKIAKACVESKGAAYRVGGDEFALILPNHAAQEAVAVAEQLRIAVNQAPLTSRLSGSATILLRQSIQTPHYRGSTTGGSRSRTFEECRANGGNRPEASRTWEQLRNNIAQTANG